MALPVMFAVCSSSEPSAVSPDRWGLLGGLIVSNMEHQMEFSCEYKGVKGS